MLKAVVELDGLPQLNHDGNEVVLLFKLEGFDNNGTFYTDSNGLQMQKRQLNLGDKSNSISHNWYPITSAITLLDGNKVFSVMNDHAQGGSSL